MNYKFLVISLIFGIIAFLINPAKADDSSKSSSESSSSSSTVEDYDVYIPPE
uniref:Putative secreted salivary protein n=1 Tax=Xenopsylla cheopis TaxID=163159 RepID=A2IA87_XENCH|nr:putative secreted salivary protein [Xenopsylla cheopis]